MKDVDTVPQQVLHVDTVDPYIVHDTTGNNVEFQCITMIDLTNGWFEMVELSTISVQKKY